MSYGNTVHVYHTSCVATLAVSPRQGLVNWNCSYTTSLTSQALVCTMTSLLVWLTVTSLTENSDGFNRCFLVSVVALPATTAAATVVPDSRYRAPPWRSLTTALTSVPLRRSCAVGGVESHHNVLSVNKRDAPLPLRKQQPADVAHYHRPHLNNLARHCYACIIQWLHSIHCIT